MDSVTEVNGFTKPVLNWMVLMTVTLSNDMCHSGYHSSLAEGIMALASYLWELQKLLFLRCYCEGITGAK